MPVRAPVKQASNLLEGMTSKRWFRRKGRGASSTPRSATSINQADLNTANENSLAFAA